MYIAASILQPLGWYCKYTIPSPKSRLHTDHVPGRSGEYLFGADYEPRVITLTLTSPRMTSITKPTVRHDLGRYFVGQQELWIGNICYNVKYSGMMDVIPYSNYFIATVPLKMTDPFGYSIEHSQVNAGTCTNAGNIETYPKIEIGPSTNPSVTINGVSLSYTGTIATGHTLTIDCEAQTVYDNTTNVIQNFTGDFVAFQVGANIVTGTATFKWRDKFI